jgi:hypothetical protein
MRHIPKSILYLGAPRKACIFQKEYWTLRGAEKRAKVLRDNGYYARVVNSPDGLSYWLYKGPRVQSAEEQ